MRVQDLPPPSPFMFRALAPFLIAIMILLPASANPADRTGWIVLVTFWLLCLLACVGLWNPKRYWWCWRAVGGILCLAYTAYLVSMIVSGPWLGDGRRSSTTVLNAMLGFIAFGYPGFMYAVFGRFTLARPTEIKSGSYSSEHPDLLMCPDCDAPIKTARHRTVRDASHATWVATDQCCICHRKHQEF